MKTGDKFRVHNSRKTILKYAVYVFYCYGDGGLYIGFSSQLKRRLRSHYEKRNLLTRSRGELKLIFIEFFYAKTDALRREAYLKTSPGLRSLNFNLAESIQNVRGR